MKLTWWSGGSSWLAAVNGGVGSSACLDRVAVAAQLEECVSFMVLPLAPATVVGAKQRRWRSDEVRCGNAGLQWASSSAKVSAVCLSSWRN